MLSHRLSIMLVDDSSAMRKIIRYQLAEMGLRSVLEAANGEQAIEAMRSWTPDVVLSDYDMSPVNGSQLLAHVRSNPRLMRVPFVMVTAHIVRFAEAGRDGGITHYLAKPFKAVDLQSKINAAVAAAQLRV